MRGACLPKRDRGICERRAARLDLSLNTDGASAADPAKTRDINCAKSVRNLLAFCLSWFLSGGGLAKDSAGPARRRPPTA